MKIGMLLMATSCTLWLAACGGEEKSGNAVRMQDMEVVDGTTSDAMTDLDGVKSEGTAMELPVGNATNAETKPAAPAAAEAGNDAEVVSDQ